MATMNKIILIGHLGRDPEVREFEGRKVANFSMATTEKVKGQDHTEWFRVSFWGNTAEVAEQYLKKGDQVYVEGRLRTREYTDNEGKNRIALEVLGQNMTMLGKANNSGQPSSNNPSQSVNDAKVEDNFPSSQPEDDLPF